MAFAVESTMAVAAVAGVLGMTHMTDTMNSDTSNRRRRKMNTKTIHKCAAHSMMTTLVILRS